MNEAAFHLHIVREAIAHAEMVLHSRRSIPATDPAGRLLHLFAAIRWLRSARTNLALAEAALRAPARRARARKGGRR